MAELNYPEDTLVVVATGAEAKTFRVKNRFLQHDTNWHPQNLDNEGPSGKRPPDVGENDNDEATFSKQIAERLYAMAHAGQFQHLILIADPQTLGEIRPLLHREVSDKIVLDLAKTLVNSPVLDIERSISAA